MSWSKPSPSDDGNCFERTPPEIIPMWQAAPARFPLVLKAVEICNHFAIT